MNCITNTRNSSVRTAGLRIKFKEDHRSIFSLFFCPRNSDIRISYIHCLLQHLLVMTELMHSPGW